MTVGQNAIIFKLNKILKRYSSDKYFLLLLTIFYFIFRIKFNYSTLETDSGSYAYMAQEILRGKIPYIDYFDHKPPGIYYLYSIALLISRDPWFLNFLASLGVYLNGLLLFNISKKLFSNVISRVIFIFYLFSLSLNYIQGNIPNTEIFLSLFLLMSLKLLIEENSKLGKFLCGLSISFAVIFKTTALGGFLGAFIWLSLKPEKRKQIIPFLVGFLTPIVIIFSYYFLNGGIKDFWFANYTYNIVYANKESFFSRFLRLPLYLMVENSLLWAASFMGIIFVSFYWKKINVLNRSIILAYILYLLFSFIFIQYLGKSYGHYYIQIYPYLILLVPYQSCFLKTKVYKKAIFMSDLVLMLISFIFFIRFYFIPTDEMIKMQFHRGDWIYQDVLLSNEIKKLVREGDYIYNIGRESQIYFYTNTRSSSKFYYDRPIEYFPNIINKVCDDLKVNKPKLVINTLVEPYFSSHSSTTQFLENCIGNIVKKEKILFADVWFTQ